MRGHRCKYPFVINFLKNSLNSLDVDQARHFVMPDRGPNCLKSVSTDDKRINDTSLLIYI